MEIISVANNAYDDPVYVKLQELVHTDDQNGGWNKCWEERVTPWDLGEPTPVILNLLQNDMLPKGRILVPGCGSGYDVIAMAGPQRHVVGLDISDLALNRAKELSSTSPNANYISFLKEDFFSWHPTELFDLIIDYMFFVAIEPSMRSAWARQVCNLLKPEGELITLICPISNHVGGPPFGVSVVDYEELLYPLGFKALSIVDNELAVAHRKGKEKLGRWKKSFDLPNYQEHHFLKFDDPLNVVDGL